MKSIFNESEGPSRHDAVSSVEDVLNNDNVDEEESTAEQENFSSIPNLKRVLEYLDFLSRHGGNLGVLKYDIEDDKSVFEISGKITKALDEGLLKENQANHILELLGVKEKISSSFKVGDFVNWKNPGFEWSNPKRVKSFGEDGYFFVEGLKAPLLVSNFKKIESESEQKDEAQEEKNEETKGDMGLVLPEKENSNPDNTAEDETGFVLTEEEKQRLYSDDPYEVLGISSDETDLNEIAKKWKKLRVRFNTDDPDNNKTGEDFVEISKRINLAYEKIVKDIKSKAEFSFEGGVFNLRGRKFRMFDLVTVVRTSGKIEKDWFFVGVYEHRTKGRMVTVQGKDQDGSSILKDVTIDEFLLWQDQYQNYEAQNDGVHTNDNLNTEEANSENLNSEKEVNQEAGKPKNFDMPSKGEDTVVSENLLNGEVAPETEEQMRERLDRELASARSDYASLLIEWKNKHREKKSWFKKIADDLGFEKQMPESELPQELLDAEKAYIFAKKNKAKLLFGKNQTKVEYIPGMITAGIEIKYQFNQELLDETENEYRVFQKRLLDNIPPQEKTRIGKLFEKWSKLPLPARIAISTTILTTVGFASGTVVAGGVAAAAAYKFTRSVAGATAGQTVGKIYGEKLKQDIKQTSDEARREYATDISEENYEEREKEMMRFKEKETNQLKKNILKKGLVTAAVAGLTNLSEDFLVRGATGGIPGGSHIIEAKSGAGNSALDLKPRVGQEISSVKTHIEPVKVELSPKGFIQTFDDLKEKMRLKYPNPDQMPKGVRDFMDTNSTKLAEKYGFYDPEKHLSGMGMKGEQIGFDDKGEFVYKSLKGPKDIVMDSGDGKIHTFKDIGGKMFDSSKVETPSEPVPQEVKFVMPEPTHAETPVLSELPHDVISTDHTPPDFPVSSESLPGSISKGFDITFDSKPFHVDITNIAGQKEVLVDGVRITDQVPSSNGMMGNSVHLLDKYQDGKRYAPIREAFNKAMEVERANNPLKLSDGQNITDLPFENGKINILRGFGEDKNAVNVLLNGKEIAKGVITDKGPNVKIFSNLKGGIFFADTVYERALKAAEKTIKKLEIIKI